jgi:alcohol dehydrogenase
VRALVYRDFRGPLSVETVAEPTAPDDGAVIEVRATGICRSDWHGWQGHDPDITTLPHIPGHEFAGVVVNVGRDVRTWRPGDRVTMPFVAGCGSCRECKDGAAQVCDRQFQPGFTDWGSFAEAVAVRYADFNLVRLPDELDFVSAASLGCRVATAYRAIVLQGRLKPGEWVAVFGCGGLGLSAVMLAAACGARPIAIDVHEAALVKARDFGAAETVNANQVENVPALIHKLTARGADLALDCLGSGETAASSLTCLRKRGRHVQVGLLTGDDFRPRLPMELVVARELEIIGSHGLAAADYPALLDLVTAGKIDVARLVGRKISLDEAPQALADLPTAPQGGVTVIDRLGSR